MWSASTIGAESNPWIFLPTQALTIPGGRVTFQSAVIVDTRRPPDPTTVRIMLLMTAEVSTQSRRFSALRRLNSRRAMTPTAFRYPDPSLPHSQIFLPAYRFFWFPVPSWTGLSSKAIAKQCFAGTLITAECLPGDLFPFERNS